MIYSIMNGVSWVIIFSVFLCNNVRAQSSAPIIDASKFEKSISFSEIFTEIKYVPLETNENCYLSYPTQIQFDDSLIFFQDHEKDEVFVFTTSGVFLNKIGESGRGPNEILHYGDFHLDKNKDRIEIHDRGRDKLLVYDYRGGFYNTKSLLWNSCFEKTTRGNYLLYSGYRSGFFDSEYKPIESPIVLVNDQLEVINEFKTEFIPFGLGTLGIMSLTVVSIFKDTLLFCPNRSTVIYQYLDNHLQPRYILDFGRRNLPEKYHKLNDFHSSQLNDWQTDYVLEVYDYSETEECCIFHFPFNKESHQAIIDKSDLSVKIARRKDYINDLDKIKPKYFTLKSVYNNYLVAYIQSLDFQEQVDNILAELSPRDRKVYESKYPNVLDVYKKAGENDNPIIILYKYRQD